MVTTREGTFAINLVAVERDGVEVVTSHVRGGDEEVRADASLAKDLFEGLLVHGIELHFFDEWDGVGCVWVGDWFWLESIEWHERYTSGLLLQHDIQDARRRFVSVHNDME